MELHGHELSVSAIAARLVWIARRFASPSGTAFRRLANGPRAPRPCVVDPFVSYVTERVRAFPELSVKRLLREIRAMGYPDSCTALGDLVREVQPPRQRSFEVRIRRPRPAPLDLVVLDVLDTAGIAGP